MKLLKIMHIGSLDPCGSGYWLSRGINKFTRNFAVNVRFVDDWSRTPARARAHFHYYEHSH